MALATEVVMYLLGVEVLLHAGPSLANGLLRMLYF